MSDTDQVISAFLDDEPFDAAELLAALSDPAGRELLIDLVALRHLTQADGTHAARGRGPQKRSILRGLVAAAAVVIALVGGYVAGERRSLPGSPTSFEAPTPTRIVEPSSTWQTVIPGRTR
jgi:hypothetical protein